MSTATRTTPAVTAFGVAAIAALAGGVLWAAFGTPERSGRTEAAVTDAPLIGYAPSAPPTAGMLRYDVEYPAIPYTAGPRTDRVAGLIERLSRGEAQLRYEPKGGYLPALLAALDIDVSSQMLVFSQTSLQSRLIGPSTPRAVYFNDDVYVAFVQGAPLEIAAVDPSLGPVFYLLEQTPAAEPNFTAELGRCLACHDSYSLTGGGVPRFIVGSGYTGTTGTLVSHEGWILISDRTPFKNRFGGWYVTGQHGSQMHLGNLIIKSFADFDRLDELRVGNLDTVDGLLDARPYLTNTSDIVALLVLQHQTDVQNLINRLSWDARSPAEQREESLEDTAERLVRALLFVDAVEYTEPISGRPEFAAQFARRAVRDAQGRSLRDFDLTRRLFRYPLSYVVYSPAFDALPDEAKSLVQRRLGEVLTGRDTSEDFAHLSAADRTAILDILRETKPSLVGAVAN